MLVMSGAEGFRSVVVITLASHARGPGFEPQRNQILLESSKPKFLSGVIITFIHELGSRIPRTLRVIGNWSRGILRHNELFVLLIEYALTLAHK